MLFKEAKPIIRQLAINGAHDNFKYLQTPFNGVPKNDVAKALIKINPPINDDGTFVNVTETVDKLWSELFDN